MMFTPLGKKIHTHRSFPDNLYLWLLLRQLRDHPLKLPRSPMVWSKDISKPLERAPRVTEYSHLSVFPRFE